MPSFPKRPKLRKVERFDLPREDDPRFVLRDPLGLCEPVSLAAGLKPVLDLLDGTRTAAQVGQSLRLRGAAELGREEVQDLLEELSEAGWLDDDRFRERWAEALHDYLEAPVRAPRYADVLYPGQPAELLGHLRACAPLCAPTQTGSDVLGVLVPHGPPELVGEIVSATAQALPPAEEIELVVVLGTDHAQGLLPMAATTKPYATPLGTTRVDAPMLAALERRLPWIFREEIRHRDGVSLELAVLYLQHVYGGSLPPLLPLLCGRKLVEGIKQGEVEACFGALESLLDGRRVLFWGSAELSHAGPAYGRPELDDAERARVAEHDRSTLAALGSGDPVRLASRCAEASPQGRPSGGAVMTTLAALLPSGFRLDLAAYARAPAPGPVAGEIGLAGVRFRPGFPSYGA